MDNVFAFCAVFKHCCTISFLFAQYFSNLLQRSETASSIAYNLYGLILNQYIKYHCYVIDIEYFFRDAPKKYKFNTMFDLNDVGIVNVRDGGGKFLFC